MCVCVLMKPVNVAFCVAFSQSVSVVPALTTRYSNRPLINLVQATSSHPGLIQFAETELAICISWTQFQYVSRVLIRGLRNDPACTPIVCNKDFNASDVRGHGRVNAAAHSRAIISIIT